MKTNALISSNHCSPLTLGKVDASKAKISVMTRTIVMAFGGLLALAQFGHADIALKGPSNGSPTLSQGQRITSGWAFTVNSMIDVTQLGVYDSYGNGLACSQKISIWRVSDQSRIATTTIGQGSTGSGSNQIAFQAITPVTLLPNTQYILTFYQSSSSIGDAFLSSSVPLTIGSGINIENSRKYISSDAFPNQTTTDMSSMPFGPTFVFNLTKFEVTVIAAHGAIVSDFPDYLPGSTANLTAQPHPGYVFGGWTHDASGTTNPVAIVMNGDKTVGASFLPDPADTDNDGISNYQEIVERGTNPNLPDTDNDGVKDAADDLPLDPLETLDTDKDGIGDNADTDDDGDGYSDADEIDIHHTNPKRADSDGDGLSDPAEIQNHHTDPNIADTDSDGLSDGAEINSHGTLPLNHDTDGDGFLDGYEVQTGKSPLNILDKPALVAEAVTAIEFTFPSALGKTYRIESSTDLSVWATVESGVPGNGSVIQRFYSIRNIPKRYFRVEEDTP